MQSLQTQRYIFVVNEEFVAFEFSSQKFNMAHVFSNWPRTAISEPIQLMRIAQYVHISQ